MDILILVRKRAYFLTKSYRYLKIYDMIYKSPMDKNPFFYNIMN